MAENSSSVPIFSCTALWSGPVNVIGRQCLWDTRDGFFKFFSGPRTPGLGLFRTLNMISVIILG